jgi:hypothetical protein
MMRRIRFTPSPALVVAIAALIVALCGVAVASVTVHPSSNAPNTIHGCVKSGKLRISGKCRKREKGLDFLAGSAASSLVGPQGVQGPKGDEGAAGSKGNTGPSGSPDTAAQVLSKLTTVDGDGSGLDADTLDGINSDGFVKGGGSEESSSIGIAAGNPLDAEELVNVGKLTLTCANPAQAKSRYVNESGGDQRVFIDEGSGTNTSQDLSTGNATADSAAGASLNDAKHVTYFARTGGYLLYDVWMTTAVAGSSGSCAYYVTRHAVG